MLAMKWSNAILGTQMKTMRGKLTLTLRSKLTPSYFSGRHPPPLSLRCQEYDTQSDDQDAQWDEVTLRGLRKDATTTTTTELETVHKRKMRKIHLIVITTLLVATTIYCLFMVIYH